MLRLWDCGVEWASVNPAPGVYDWTRLDRLVARAKAAGVRRIIYTLAVTPPWAASKGKQAEQAPWLPEGSNRPPADLVVWEQFVTALVTRYRGRINAYQIWNEPQLRWFWAPESFDVLAEMTRRAARIVHLLDRSALVVAAPVLPRPSSGGMRRGGRYLSALKGRGWNVDVWSAHLYPEEGEPPARWREFCQEWARTLVELRAPKRPRWVTETNANLMCGPLPVGQQGGYVRRVAQIAEAERIGAVVWYAFGHHTDPAVLGVPFVEGSPGMAALEAIWKG
jgi:hypothetical protein